jgi:hypothetical protein
MRMTVLAGSMILGLNAASPAAAAMVTYDWRGTVDVVEPGFPAGVTVGETIGLSLTIDTSFPDQDPAPNSGLYTNDTQPGTPLILSSDIGGDTHTGIFQTMTVLDGANGVDEIQIETGDPQTGQGFIITFSTPDLGVLASDAIPSTIDPADFETATFAVVRESALEEFLPGFSGTIDAQVPVPEPSTLELLATALVSLAGFGLVSSYRRRDELNLLRIELRAPMDRSLP